MPKIRSASGRDVIRNKRFAPTKMIKCDLMCVNDGTSGLQVRCAVACKHPCFRFHIFRLTFRCAGSVCIAAEQVRLSKSKSWGIGHGSERQDF